MKLCFTRGIIVVVASSLAACAVGPDFVKPEAPKVSSYAAEGDLKNHGVQQITYDKREVGMWWDEFHSHELTKVMQLGIKNNYSLVAMQETLAQAKEIVSAQTGKLWPQVNLNASAGRQKYGVALFGPSNIAIPPFTYYEIGPSVNLLLDFFGGTRRTIEKQQALMTYQNEELNAAFLSLTGNIATTAVTIATINEKIKATKRIIYEDHKNLDFVQQAFRLGSATQTEVLSAQSQQESDETLLPALYQQLTVAKDTLTVLMGMLPANWEAPNFVLHDFVLPKRLSLTLPSELVHKRPDILAAEAMLHAASADVGIATANLYPAINLSGSLMQEALSPSNLFKASANAWGVLGGLTAPIFSGGTLRAERRAAIHAYQSAYANYQQVVLKAFSQVNDILHAIKSDEQAIIMEKKALKTAQSSLRLARLSYHAGNVGVLQVLDAERLYTQAKLGYVQADAQRYQDTVQLYVVLGG
jgi:NodT family efflux transporter outer membrane factor (OMF) lipoprotein